MAEDVSSFFMVAFLPCAVNLCIPFVSHLFFNFVWYDSEAYSETAFNWVLVEFLRVCLKNGLLALQDESVKNTAQLMYQTALMESGFTLSDPKDFASRIHDSVKSGLNISPDAAVEEDDDADEAETESKEEASAPPKDEAEDAETPEAKDEL